MELEMKYFVLKPRAKTQDDVFAKASQRAMSTYAETLEDEGVELVFARELSLWSVNELIRQKHLPDPEEPS